MANFRTEKKFVGSGTVTDGYDDYTTLIDGVSLVEVSAPNQLSDSILEVQKAILDGYITTHFLPQAISFEDSETLIFDSTLSKMVPGSSGDSSFKLQSVTDPSAVIKAGYILLDDGRELEIASDLTINLTTILGSAPAASTSYYLYVKISSATESTTANGRKVFSITGDANFTLSTTLPQNQNLAQLLPIGVIKSSAVPDWTGNSFDTVAARRHDLGNVVVSPTAYNLAAITAVSHPAATTITHSTSVATKDQKWSAQVQTTTGLIYQPNDSEWITDIVDSDSILVDFSFLAPGDTASIQLENRNLTGANVVSVKSYDSGLIAANTLDALLPITHQLSNLPTQLVLLKEIVPGELQAVDVGGFISATDSQLKGDLSSLTTTKVRLIASTGASAISQSLFSTKLESAATSAAAGDEVLVDSTAAVTVTLPTLAKIGDRVRVIDVKGLAATNNITVARNGHNIRSLAADFTVNTNFAFAELIYVDVAMGWAVIE